MPDAINLLRLSQAFNVSVSYLLCQTDSRDASNIELSRRFGIDDRTYRNIKEINTLDNTFKDTLGKVLTNVSLYKKIVNSLSDYYDEKSPFFNHIDYAIYTITDKFKDLIKKYIENK